MNLPKLRQRDVGGIATAGGESGSALTGLTFDEHMEQSELAQRRADKWLISGSLLIGTAALGVFGLPLFLRGVQLLRRAQRDGLSVRPMLVTLLGYLVIIDAAINTVGWALDLVANHSLLARVLLNGWGNMFDAGYFWHYNELWVGGAAGPGEKALEVGLILDCLHDADCRCHRLPANEALGASVDGRHLLDGCGDLGRLRLQHDHVRRRALCRSRVAGGRLVALRHLLHHALPRDPLSAHRQPRALLRLKAADDHASVGRNCTTEEVKSWVISGRYFDMSRHGAAPA